jgi:hypothetical protein
MQARGISGLGFFDLLGLRGGWVSFPDFAQIGAQQFAFLPLLDKHQIQFVGGFAQRGLLK